MFLQRIVLQLATKLEIQMHINNNLQSILIVEKEKKRHRDKYLNLLDQETVQEPQFFSPEKILAAKTYQENKKTTEQDGKYQKVLQKKEAIHRCQQFQTEKQKAKKIAVIATESK